MLLSVPAPAFAEAGAGGAVVEQGTGIVNPARGIQCRVGFVDAASRSAYTAGHCGKSGDKIYVREVSGVRRLVGTIQSHVGEHAARNDWGVVALSPDARIGANHASGDAKAQPAVGTVVCRQDAAAKACGTVLGRDGGTIIVSPELAGAQGDSGAAVYSEHGFVGVYAGVWREEGKAMAAAAVELAVVPGAEVNYRQFLDPQPAETVVTPVIPNPGVAPEPPEPVQSKRCLGSSLSSFSLSSRRC